MNTREQVLDRLAAQYHEQCETFDRIHCKGTSPRTGHALPVDNDEFITINRHALKIKRELTEEASRHGITAHELSRAISQWGGVAASHSL